MAKPCGDPNCGCAVLEDDGIDHLQVTNAYLDVIGLKTVYFTGSHEACTEYMRQHGGRNPSKKFDLMYTGSGRLASYVL